MTSIHTYDLKAGPALPELPPLPIGALAVGTAELLQQAADLPQPSYLTVSDTQSIDLQFAPATGERAGHHPVGSPVRQRHDQPARHGHATAPRPGTGPIQLLRHRPSRPTPTSRPPPASI